jgi:hypothetical protein
MALFLIQCRQKFAFNFTLHFGENVSPLLSKILCVCVCVYLCECQFLHVEGRSCYPFENLEIRNNISEGISSIFYFCLLAC